MAASAAHDDAHKFVPHPRDDFTDDDTPLQFHAGDKVVFRAPGTGQMLGGKVVRVAHHCTGERRVSLDMHSDDGNVGTPYYIIESESLNKCCGCYAEELRKFSGPSFAAPSGSFIKNMQAEEKAAATAKQHAPKAA